MPKIYLRRTVNQNNLEAYEVVDGQQRLSIVLEFKKGNLNIYKKHNPYYADCKYSNLPDSLQRRFLDYELSVEIVEDASDPDIWSLFERLNTYTITLNRQERLNARWFGYFKQTCYGLAAQRESLDIWKKMIVFSDKQISRMKEVELASDVIVAMVRGISDIKWIKTLYKDYDDEFPQKDQIEHEFSSSLGYIAENLEQPVRSTRFRRVAWFYSLLVAITDAIHGIPQGLGPHSMESGAVIASRMYQLDEALKSPEPPSGLQDLHSTLSRSTVHTRERNMRWSPKFGQVAKVGFCS